MAIVETEVTAGVATVLLNRPEARNALSREMRETLAAVVGRLDRSPEVGAIILSGTDPAFCSGVDLKEMKKGGHASADIAARTEPLLVTATPLIGAVNGPAYTGGLELALTCHFLVASERATFADTHALHGLTPGWGMSVLLSEAVGRRRARQMSYSSQPIGASTALTWGLVNAVVPHGDLLPTCRAIADAIVGNDATIVHTLIRLHDDQAAQADAASWGMEARAWSGTRPT